MRKSFLFAAASIAMLCSCSQDEAPTANNSSEDNGLVEIKIGVANELEVNTKGTGTVGGTTVETNVWSGQTLNVCMFDAGTLEYATEDLDNDKVETNIFDASTTLKAPDAKVSGEAIRTDELVKYYPAQGCYDFWGYHLDDAYVYNGIPVGEAGSNAPEKVKNDDGTESLVVPFVIDGSQDIMAAKAVPTADEINAVGDASRIYSAYAARRNVQPTLKFEHLLTRLTFQIKGGDASVCEGGTGNKISVSAIKIKSKTTGKFIIAYTGDTEKEQIVFDETVEPAWLTLKQRPDVANQNENLEDLDLAITSPKLDGEGNPVLTPIGEALIIEPADEYEIEVTIIQYVPTDINGTKENFTYVYPATFKPTTGTTFEAGMSYNVNMTLWGLKNIEINTELTPWGAGADINLPIEDLQ